MALLLALMAVVFAAAGVWLTVRIVNRREKWAKRTLAMVLAPAIYVMSFGPACWISSVMNGPNELLGWIFGPLIEATAVMPEPVQVLFCRYATVGMPNDAGVQFFRGEDSDRATILSKSDFRLLMIGRRKSNTTRVNPPHSNPDDLSESD